MRNARALLFRQHGPAGKVVELGELELPGLLPNEVCVRVLLAPINPADLNTIEGTYPVRPALPAVPGGEGVGVIEEVGSAVETLKKGDRVLLPYRLGTWREAVNVPADKVIVVPAGVTDEQAAMIKINPATALRMLTDFIALQPGDWVIQNASNSAVGRAVIEIAHRRGLRTVNVVRRPELIEELRLAGAEVVIVDSERLADEVALVTEERLPKLGLNAVGGESALRVAGSLAHGGTLVTYGAMSRQALRIPNGLLIFKDLAFRGYWLSLWFQNSTAEERDAMFAELFSMAADGMFQTPVDRRFRLEQYADALELAGKGGRKGKVLFEF